MLSGGTARETSRRRGAAIAAAVLAAALAVAGCSALLPGGSGGSTTPPLGGLQPGMMETPGSGPAGQATANPTMVTAPQLGPTTGAPGAGATTGTPSSPSSTSASPPAATTPGTSASPSPAGPTTTAAGAGGLTVTAADRAQAAATVASMSTADKAASVIMVTGSQAIGTGLLGKAHFGGVILFAPGGVVDGTRNGTPPQVAAVTAGLRMDAADDPAGVPPLIATDQEYGAVQRLKNGFTSFPGESQVGAIADDATAVTLTRQMATAAAQEMLAVGVTVDFAPVFGVLPANGAASAIGEYGRSYGAEPQRVASLVAAAVRGYQQGGVVAAMKHFPGLARIAADSHVTLPTLGVSCSDWNAHEAVPAKAGIRAGALMVMTGHVLLPAAGDTSLPASISPDVVEKLLRGNGSGGCGGMNFGGVTVTDSLQMEPITAHGTSGSVAVAALGAGEDLLLMPVSPTAAAAGIVAAVRSGTLAAARLDEAATAVLALRIASARMPRPPLDVVHSAAHQALADRARDAAR